MRSKLLLIALGSALAGCQTPSDIADKGLASVNVPVVTAADYVFDAQAPNGSLVPGEAQRLDGWFQGLGLGYGDSVYVDGYYAGPAREEIAAVAGRYGMLVSDGSPVTSGVVQPGTVRVVVSRRRAEVPGCPKFNRPSEPDWENRQTSNFGCGVNSNLAAMVADPQDLLYGREGNGVGDARTAAKAIEFYRATPPSGTKGLMDVTPKGSN